MNHSSPLALPVGLLMRGTYTVEPFESIEVAVKKLRENGSTLLPIVEDSAFSGVVSERILVSALATGVEVSSPVSSVAHGCLTIQPSATGAEALRLMEEGGEQTLVVIDQNGRVIGILSAIDLYSKRTAPPRPPLVGGMATPFGVHLTTGGLRAGVSHWALISTGAVMFTLLIIGNLLGWAIVNGLDRFHPANWILTTLQAFLPLLFFAIGMRLIPLSGIHAAEHKVVHAIERGEELTPAVVRRMPRVHPRCGTNIAAGASLFIGLSNADFIPVQEFRFLIAGIATLAFWRPLGSWLQYWVTTKEPNDKQIALGIRSGKLLLEKFATQGSGSTSIAGRIFNSGLLHVIAGSLLALGIFSALTVIFHLPLDIS